MKSRFFAFLVLATAAAAACSHDDATDPLPAGREMTLAFTSDKPALEGDTRTVFEDGSVLWSATGEKIRIAHANNGAFAASQTFYVSNSASVSSDRRKATFSFTGTVPTDPGSYTFHALYPSAASSMSKLEYGSEISAKILPTQTPSAASFDPAADVMVASSRDTYPSFSEQDVIPLAYKRLAAHGCVTLTGLAFEAGETVDNVTFTAPAATKIAGSVYIDLLQKQVTQTTEAVNTLTLAYNAAALDAQGAFRAWFCSLPFEIASGEQLAVEVATPRGTYTRTITARAEGIHFLQNRYNTLAIDMSTATFTPNPSAASIFNVTFGTTSKNVTYNTNYNMGATGTSASTLEYAFSASSEQIRYSNTISGYEGASEGAYWWATKQSTFTVSGIDISNKQHLALTFGAGYANSTVQASISVDGQFFYPLSADAVSVTTTAGLKTLNFSLASTYPTCSIRLENTGSTTVVIDDVQLKALDEAAPDAYIVDISPIILSTPADGETMTFAANNGTETGAPAEQTIDYSWSGDNCTFSVEKGDADNWFTVTDNGTGQITIRPDVYTSKDADRSGSVRLVLTKAGAEVASNTVTILQRKVGERLQATLELNVSSFGNSWSGYANKTATVTGSDQVGYVIAADQVVYNVDYLQARSSKNSAIYNTTTLGSIASIAITDATGATFKVNVGNAQKPTTTEATATDKRNFTVAETGNGFFRITVSNTTIAKINKIVIVYTPN